ncbi:MAG: ferrochelatase [Paludisphaera borealis]|uniref:ferrochelatase n=1 Tax=Paludisphaera borealis TaxID=1387353 RepID=UPI002847EE37|nr:ferrochelatase [Paludisphaera borealis]MDR3620124.1 ferrochelatase [Paludisphaera borealis]
MIRPELSVDQRTKCEIETTSEYDAILIVGFGGPEKPEDVMPFLENVTRGRNIPRERLEEVAEHYHHFGGVSPINEQVRSLMATLGPELRRHGVTLPIYWGNRNWTPMLPDTLREMAAAGVKKSLAIVLAAYSSYSSCRQYREDIGRAREEVGPTAPEVAKTRVFYNHPEFITANADRVREALAKIPAEDRGEVPITFTAHSIPAAMAANSLYEEQLRETCRLVAAELNVDSRRWSLVYQSRSGRPGDLWLEPDILDHLRDVREQGAREVIVHPIGFLSDHMEVLYDLDEEAQQLCEKIGLNMVRSSTVGTHRGFVRMLCELVCERLQGAQEDEKRALGRFGPSHDECPLNCCLPPVRPQNLAHAKS